MFYRILYLGAMECRKYRMICTDHREENIRIPVYALWIRHPKLGNIIYDTGNAPHYREELTEDTKASFPIVEYRSLEQAMKEAGLTPEDVDLIIMSHLHFDHAGGLRLFSGTKAGKQVMIGKAEWERAREAAGKKDLSGYVAEQYLTEGISFCLLEKDCWLADDMRVFAQNSHSPSLLGLELHVPDQSPLICVSDAVYLRENYERELPPDSPNQANASGFLENLQILKQRQREIGGEILFGHDMNQIDALRKRGLVI
ncbi:MAG: N-acyl homoserine lactonase family protein [Clostridiales bacterium]|nr:N-acyl homoserine lactonase family protein [Clostridiales bacterium]